MATSINKSKLLGAIHTATDGEGVGADRYTHPLEYVGVDPHSLWVLSVLAPQRDPRLRTWAGGGNPQPSASVMTGTFGTQLSGKSFEAQISEAGKILGGDSATESCGTLVVLVCVEGNRCKG